MQRSPPRKERFPLYQQIFAAILLAVVFGLLTHSEVLPAKAVAVYTFMGTLFLNALKMLIIPLIIPAIVSGVANISSDRNFGRLGAKTIGYYLLSSLFAILVGLVLVNFFKPGLDNGVPATVTLGIVPSEAEMEMADKLSEKGGGDIIGIFLRMLPPNLFEAATEMNMLGLIVFSMIFGFFLGRDENTTASTLRRLFDEMFEIMMRITHMVMRFAPIGVFGLVAREFATTGLGSFGFSMKFFAVVLAGLAIHLFITLPVMMMVLGRGKTKPSRHFKAMAPALLTAFSTSSSSATLPVTMDCLERRGGVPKRHSSFVLPLGATVNMDGTALYECMAALFIAQAYGIEITFATQFTVVVLALLTSIGVAGIPQASLTAIVVILDATGVPAAGIGLLLVVDRLLDMCRTAVNIFSDSVGALLISQSEGEALDEAALKN